MCSEQLFRVLLAVFATYRIATLITYDDGLFNVFADFRAMVGRNAAASSKWKHFADLINCPYCVGLWVAIFMLIPIFYPSLLGDGILIAFAIAGGQVFLETIGGDRDG